MGKNESSEKNKKSFWKEKKNVAIIVLSVLLFLIVVSYPKDSTKLNNEINKLQGQVTSLNQELEIQIDENNDEKLQELEKQILDKDSHIQNLEAQIQDKDSHIQNLEAQIQDKDVHIQNLESQINILNEEKSNLDSKITELTEENNSLQSKNTTKSTIGISESVQQTTTAQVTAAPDNSSYTVYVTKTGEKYHRDGCRYLKSSKIAKDKNTAVAQGYTACSVCSP